MPVVKALTVNFELIVQSMRDITRETSDYYLDKTTGRVICLSRELIRAFSKDDDARDDVPEWDASLIPLARDIVLAGADQYLRIPEAFGRPEHAWMVDFCKDIKNAKLRQKLLAALRGRGSCKRFKALLDEGTDDTRRWMAFQTKKWEERIQAWLETHGILAVNKTGRSRPAAK